MAKYAVYHNAKAELKIKDKADLLEAFIGALYVDQVCYIFCAVITFLNFHYFFIYLLLFLKFTIQVPIGDILCLYLGGS